MLSGRWQTSLTTLTLLLTGFLAGCATPDYQSDPIARAKRINELMNKATDVVSKVATEVEDSNRRGRPLDTKGLLARMESAGDMAREAMQLHPSSQKPRELYVQILIRNALLYQYDRVGFEERISKAEESGQQPAPELVEARDSAERKRVQAYTLALREADFHMQHLNASSWPDGHIFRSTCLAALYRHGEAAQALRDYLEAVGPHAKKKHVEDIQRDIQTLEERALSENDASLRP